MYQNKYPVNILDCTLRDGGYYNNWDFEESLVKEYIQAINSSKVDYIEIGFRSLENNDNYGPFANVSDKLISKLKIKKNCSIAIMINTSEIIQSKLGIKKSLELLLNDKKKSPVTLVRFATHFNNIDDLKEIITITKKKGYQIAVNLMQCGGKKSAEIISASKKLSNLKDLDILYFADSLGNMDSNQVKEIIINLRKNWKKPLGIHAHNNQGKAISNSLTAVDNKINLLDSTINGMGRGAGNAETEFLLSEINDKLKKKYNTKKIFKLAVNKFQSLKNFFKWGQNSFYYLAAKNNIHPTYVQEMLSEKKYSKEKILKIIEHMKNIPSSSYNKDFLDKMLNLKKANEISFKWNNLNWCKNKNIVILGGGESIKPNLIMLNNFIKEKKPIILSLNYNYELLEKVHGVIVTNKFRFLTDSINYKKINKTIYTPNNIFSDDPNYKFYKNKIRQYSSKVQKDKFVFSKNSCILPNNLAFSYALALCNIGKAKKIYLAGFDGYKNNNVLQAEMIETINIYEKLKSVPLITITSSSYPIKKYKFFNDF